MEAPRIMVFDNQDEYIMDLDPSKIISDSYTSEINGEHSLTITTMQELSKTNRLLIRDAMGDWHEYVVLGVVDEHGSAENVLSEYYCIWSLQYDLSATYIDNQFGCGVVPGHASVPQTPYRALEVALEGTTRWQIGAITTKTMASASFYRMSGWEGLKTVVERWGGEIEAAIDVSTTGVVSRAVNLLAHVGNDTATRRFDFGSDVTGITKTVSDEVWPCRIVPLGKSVETDLGGYTRRPSIADVNDGVAWVEDEEVTPLVAMRDASGNIDYPTVIVENDTYEDPSELLAWAREHVTEYTRPKVTYNAELAQFEQAGLSSHGVALGDEIVVVDRDFKEDGLRISARVVKIEGSLLDPSRTALTIGNASDTLADQLSSIAKRLSELGDAVASGVTYQSTASYLASLLSRLNDEINATGGYTYITEGQGIRTYDKAVSDPLVGSEASQVVEVKGGTIRIANSKTSSGDWDWRTVFTSGHVAADLVTAAAITAGFIGNASGGNYWNLDTGVMRLSDNVLIGSGSGTIGDLSGEREDRESIIDGLSGETRVGRSGSYRFGLSGAGASLYSAGGTTLMSLVYNALQFFADGNLSAKFGDDGVHLYSSGTLVASFTRTAITLYIGGYRAMQLTASALNFYARQSGTEYLLASFGVSGAYLYANGEPNLQLTSDGLKIYDNSRLLITLASMLDAAALGWGPGLTINKLKMVGMSGYSTVSHGDVTDPSSCYAEYRSDAVDVWGLNDRDSGGWTLDTGVTFRYEGRICVLDVHKSVTLNGSWDSVQVATVPSGYRPRSRVVAPAEFQNTTLGNVYVCCDSAGAVTVGVNGSTNPNATQLVDGQLVWVRSL